MILEILCADYFFVEHSGAEILLRVKKRGSFVLLIFASPKSFLSSFVRSHGLLDDPAALVDADGGEDGAHGRTHGLKPGAEEAVYHLERMS